MQCFPLNDSGSIAMLDTPFSFVDGDDVPVFVESAAGRVRFFDDGMVMLHFLGAGLQLDDKRKTKFLRKTAEPHGVRLTDEGVLEVWAIDGHAPTAFAKYMSALLAIVEWERANSDLDTDLTMFIEEVGMCLRSWLPTSKIVALPTYSGITRQSYALDFAVDGQPFIASGSHPNTVSAAIKKILDIKSLPENSDLSFTVVVDDRTHPDVLNKDGMVLQAVAKVLPFTSLERLAKASATAH
ncbi:MAG TPA: hypothetical protein DIW53_19600 [Achromobacter sp.]|nr:hypothetical protein [Achromobacter sp.]